MSDVVNNPERERYEISEDGELAGSLEYAERPGLIALVHTKVDERFGGRGLGGKLIGQALDDARQRGLEVLPFCSFASRYVERHPEYADLVPAAYRDRFGL